MARKRNGEKQPRKAIKRGCKVNMLMCEDPYSRMKETERKDGRKNPTNTAE